MFIYYARFTCLGEMTVADTAKPVSFPDYSVLEEQALALISAIGKYDIWKSAAERIGLGELVSRRARRQLTLLDEGHVLDYDAMIAGLRHYEGTEPEAEGLRNKVERAVKIMRAVAEDKYVVGEYISGFN